VGDDEGWNDLAFLDTVQQILGPSIYVRVARPDGQAFIHDRAEWNLVHQTTVDARHR
jgi:hypothetical protein